MHSIKQWFKDRISEPSTWAGSAILSAIVTHAMGPDWVQPITEVIAGCIAAYEVYRKEGWPWG